MPDPQTDGVSLFWDAMNTFWSSDRIAQWWRTAAGNPRRCSIETWNRSADLHRTGLGLCGGGPGEVWRRKSVAPITGLGQDVCLGLHLRSAFRGTARPRCRVLFDV